VRERRGNGGVTSERHQRWEGESKRGKEGGSLGFGDGNKCVRVSMMCPSNGKRRRVGGCEQHDNLRCFF